MSLNELKPSGFYLAYDAAAAQYSNLPAEKGKATAFAAKVAQAKKDLLDHQQTEVILNEDGLGYLVQIVFSGPADLEDAFKRVDLNMPKLDDKMFQFKIQGTPSTKITVEERTDEPIAQCDIDQPAFILPFGLSPVSAERLSFKLRNAKPDPARESRLSLDEFKIEPEDTAIEEDDVFAIISSFAENAGVTLSSNLKNLAETFLGGESVMKPIFMGVQKLFAGFGVPRVNGLSLEITRDKTIKASIYTNKPMQFTNPNLDPILGIFPAS